MEAVQPSCILCLEATRERKPSVLSCRCKFQAHQACWKKWEETKGHVECPLCHMSIVTNPLAVIVVQVNTTHPPEESHPIHTRRIVVYGECASCMVLSVLVGIIIWASYYENKE